MTHQAAQELVVRGSSSGGSGVGLVGGMGVLALNAGNLAGLRELITTHLPQVRARLDQLAVSLVAEVNAVHQTGFTLGGPTGPTSAIRRG